MHLLLTFSDRPLGLPFLPLLLKICNDSKIGADAEVFGFFRELIPAELTHQGGALQHDCQPVRLTPDLLLRLPTPDGVTDRLGELKAGVTRNPPGKTEKQADRRGRERFLPSTTGAARPVSKGGHCQVR